MRAVPEEGSISEDLDLDAVETREWMDALDSVTEFEGAERAGFLVQELVHVRQPERHGGSLCLLRRSSKSSAA